MLFITRVTEVIDRSIYDPRKKKIHGSDDRSSIKEDPGLSNIKISEFGTKKIFKEEKGEYIVYIIIMQREKHILTNAIKFCPKSMKISPIFHRASNKVLYILLKGLALVLWSSDFSA